MKRLFHLAQWAALIALVLFAWRSLMRPIPAPDYHPDEWSSWRGFYALSYAGVTRKGGGDYVSTAQLAEHLHALHEQGFKTIKPEDVETFLQGRAPLPDRAVLLLFEGGRKDSYLAATPLLRRFGQVATMCVPTILTRRWGSFYLRTSDLKRFARQPHWSLASMGHAAILPIPVEGGAEGRFLVQRQWKKRQLESLDAYRERVEKDFAQAQAILQHATSRPIKLYLLPFADAGTSPGSIPEAEETIRACIEAHHRVAFTRADDAFNGPDSDPLQLTRLRVRGSWDAQRLLQGLAKCEPRPEPIAGIGDNSQWVYDGNGFAATGSLNLAAGARAWARGSSDWSDLALSFEVNRPAGGTAALYVRYAGPSRYVRLWLDDAGLRIQERLGSTMQTLALQPATAGSPTPSNVALRTRGNRLWVQAGLAPPAGPLPLSRFTTRGRIGFEAGATAISVRAFSATPLPSLVVLSQSFRSLDRALQDATALWIPTWFHADRAPEFTPNMRSELLAAAAQGVQVIPRIAGLPRPDLDRSFAEHVAESLSEIAARTLITRIALSAPDFPLAERLRQQGYSILFEIQAKDAHALLRSPHLERESDLLLIKGNALAVGEALAEAEREIPTSRLIWKTNQELALPPGIRRAVQIESGEPP